MRRLQIGRVRVEARKTRRAARLKLEALEGRQLMAVFTVINTDDGGAGSLRQAILDANQTPGFDTINFDFQTPGEHTISPLAQNGPLPTLTEQVFIDGTGENVEIDGSNLGATDTGLNLAIGGSTIQGLTINRFGGAAIALSAAGGNVVRGNNLGTSPDGLTAQPNGVGVLVTNSTANTIGGTLTSARNVISGNTQSGILITGTGTSNNVVLGNLVGLDSTGNAALGNSIGVSITSGATFNSIGGTIAAARNVISGNASVGVLISGAGTTSNRVFGNYIGTNSSGTAPVGNDIGARLADGSSANSIGGLVAESRNVISGNLSTNAELDGVSGSSVQNNYIGTNADGVTAIGANVTTIAGVILKGVTGSTIGGASNTGNVISAAAGDGLVLTSDTNGNGSTGNLVQGNFIGTRNDGLAALGNGGFGLVISGNSTNNTVGGISAGTARNVISGNTGGGVHLTGASVTGNVLQSNFIGSGPDGTTDVGNIGAGVLVDGAVNNTIGGTLSGAGNTIAFNDAQGNSIASGDGITIRRNSIFGNTGLGIDLAAGANDDQAAPVITSASTTGSGAAQTTTVAGSLTSTPNATFVIDFYSNPADSLGEGRVYVGSSPVLTTDANGFVAFSVVTTTPVAVNQFVTGTATNTSGSGSTSEFAPNVQNIAPSVDLGITLDASPDPVATSGLITYTIHVNNSSTSSPANNTIVTNTLPAGVSLIGVVSSQGSAPTVAGSIVTANLGTLAAGATATVTITVSAPATVPAGGTLTDTATVTATDPDNNQQNNSAAKTIAVQQGAALQVTSSVSPNPANVSSGVVYTFNLTALSTNQATNTVLTMTLPAELTNISATASAGTPTVSGNVVTLDVGTIPANNQGQTVQVLVSATTPATTGTLSATATVTATQPDPNPPRRTTTVNLTVNESTTPTSNGPRVTDVLRVGFHQAQTRYQITFDNALRKNPAQLKSNYTLVAAGRDGKFGTADDHHYLLQSAVYDNRGFRVFLTTQKRIPINQPIRLTINGRPPRGLRNTAGVFLDGAGNGTPGTNYRILITGLGPGAV